MGKGQNNNYPYNNEGGDMSDNSNKMITPSRIDEHEEYSSHQSYAINKEYS